MALSKATPTPQGPSASYWKIISANMNKNSMVCSWSLGLFLDQPTADSGKSQPFMVRNYSAPLSKAQAAGDLVALGYSVIKAKDVNPPAPPAPVSGKPARPQPKQDQTLIGALDV